MAEPTGMSDELPAPLYVLLVLWSVLLLLLLTVESTVLVFKEPSWLLVLSAHTEPDTARSSMSLNIYQGVPTLMAGALDSAI
mgnify:CR=1 FL=1